MLKQTIYTFDKAEIEKIVAFYLEALGVKFEKVERYEGLESFTFAVSEQEESTVETVQDPETGKIIKLKE